MRRRADQSRPQSEPEHQARQTDEEDGGRGDRQEGGPDRMELQATIEDDRDDGVRDEETQGPRQCGTVDSQPRYQEQVRPDVQRERDKPTHRLVDVRPDMTNTTMLFPVAAT